MNKMRRWISIFQCVLASEVAGSIAQRRFWHVNNAGGLSLPDPHSCMTCAHTCRLILYHVSRTDRLAATVARASVNEVSSYSSATSASDIHPCTGTYTSKQYQQNTYTTTNACLENTRYEQISLSTRMQRGLIASAS